MKRIKKIMSGILTAAILESCFVAIPAVASDTADSIVFNASCDGEIGQAPWFWGTEDGKSGTAVTVEDETNPSNKYIRFTNREAADSGFFQWCNKPSGGEEYPAVLPENGKTYDISFRARFSSASDGAPDKETFILKFDDGILASGEVLPDTWTTVTGRYTFGSNEVDEWNAYRIITEKSMVDFDIDDVIVKEQSSPTPTPPPTQETTPKPTVNYNELIKNGDIETGSTDMWSAFGSAVLEAVPNKAHGGLYGMKISERSADWAGACQSVSGLVSGQKYHIYADVAADTAENSTAISVTITYTDENGDNQYIGIGSAVTENGEWNIIDNTFMLSGQIPETVTMYISSSYAADTIYVDNVSVKAVKDSGTRGRDIGMHNALITQRFGADPFAMEYNGRLYVYMTSDQFIYDENGELIENNYSNINSITVISSDDMVNWTDHGEIPIGALNKSDAAEPNGAAAWATNSWAPAAAHKTIDGKEKFFLYFADSGAGIGVLEADSPTGPFYDPVGEPLISPSKTSGAEGVVWCFDPAVLIDDDNQAYLYFGGGIPWDENGNQLSNNPKTARVIKLGNDMISTIGSAVEIDAPGILEDSGIHKYGDTYYYSYCTNFNCTNVPTGAIAYMTSSNPMGPFEYKGIILENMYNYFGVGGNNHHAMFEYKGQWYITYHSQTVGAALGMARGYRSSHINELEYNEDGTLKKVMADYKGIPQIKMLNPYELVEAETIAWNSGIETANYSSAHTGNMKVTSIDDGDWISVSQAEFSGNGADGFTVNAASTKCGTIEIRLDSYDGTVVGKVEIPDTGGSFEEIAADVNNITGVHDVFLTFKGDGNGLFELDSWSFTEADEVFDGWWANADIDDTGKVNITVSNNTETGADAVIYTAAYDANGILVKAAAQPHTVSAKSMLNISEDMGNTEYESMSVFVWRADTMEPLADKITVK